MPSSSPAASPTSGTSSSTAWSTTAMNRSSPNTPSSSSKASAVTGFRKATQPLALIAYASAWLKCWHPDIFWRGAAQFPADGLLCPRSNGCDAQDHHVEVRPVRINASRWDCTLEPTGDDGRFAATVRLGLRMVKGLANANAAAIVSARADTPLARSTIYGAAPACRSPPWCRSPRATVSARHSAWRGVRRSPGNV